MCSCLVPVESFPMLWPHSNSIPSSPSWCCYKLATLELFAPHFFLRTNGDQIFNRWRTSFLFAAWRCWTCVNPRAQTPYLFFCELPIFWYFASLSLTWVKFPLNNKWLSIWFVFSLLLYLDDLHCALLLVSDRSAISVCVVAPANMWTTECWIESSFWGGRINKAVMYTPSTSWQVRFFNVYSLLARKSCLSFHRQDFYQKLQVPSFKSFKR